LLKFTTPNSVPLIQLGIFGFIFDSHLTFSDQISSLSKSCYYHIRELRCIRPCLDFKTASTLATCIVHSKLDYSNSLYYSLPRSQINRLQVIQNSLARAVVKAPKFCHVTPILKSLHCLKISEHIEYKLLSLTYKALTTAQPTYLHSLISVQPPRATRSSSVVNVSRTPTSSSLKITNCSFCYASPHLWNQLITGPNLLCSMVFHFFDNFLSFYFWVVW